MGVRQQLSFVRRAADRRFAPSFAARSSRWKNGAATVLDGWFARFWELPSKVEDPERAFGAPWHLIMLPDE